MGPGEKAGLGTLGFLLMEAPAEEGSRAQRRGCRESQREAQVQGWTPPVPGLGAMLLVIQGHGLLHGASSPATSHSGKPRASFAFALESMPGTAGALSNSWVPFLLSQRPHPVGSAPFTPATTTHPAKPGAVENRSQGMSLICLLSVPFLLFTPMTPHMVSKIQTPHLSPQPKVGSPQGLCTGYSHCLRCFPLTPKYAVHSLKPPLKWHFTQRASQSTCASERPPSLCLSSGNFCFTQSTDHHLTCMRYAGC